MKKTLLSLSFCLFSFSEVASSNPPYGMAGCGLGSLVFQSNTKSSQISAATTNGTYFNQGFGITSGTSNCLPYDQAVALENQQNFITVNLDLLSKEIARGSGESLSGLAATFECKESAMQDLSLHLQKSYEKIFEAPGAIAVLSAIKDQIRGDEQLIHACPMAAI